MALERKSSLRKAPAGDVIDTLTPATQETEPATSAGSKPTERVDSSKSVPQDKDAATSRARSSRRSKRILLPFSSKIEMNLRDAMDDYLAEHDDLSIIDFLDEAIRDRLTK